MGENTKIQWCDSTFNPWIGCTKIGPGCDNCHAAAWDRRFAASGHAMRWGAGKPRARTSASNWKQPPRWNAKPFFECTCGWRGEGHKGMRLEQMVCQGRAEHTGLKPARRRVFCGSLCDVFDSEVPTEWRAELFALISATPNLDWLLLTKRTGNIKKMGIPLSCIGLALPNVWLGATISNQEDADRDIPKLLAVPAAKRFLSIEPMLGPVDLTRVHFPTGVFENALDCSVSERFRLILGKLNGIDWVICGGETGPKARPMHPDWARSLRDQCQAAGVPFFFKQWGEFASAKGLPRHLRIGHVFRDGYQMIRVGHKAACRLLDGREWNEAPE